VICLRGRSLSIALLTAVSLAIAALLPGCIRATAGTGPAHLTSTEPRYVRVILTQDGGLTMLAAFDESAGTRTGYDTVWVDLNLSGEFEADERFSGRAGIAGGKGAALHFPTVPISIAYAAGSAGQEQPSEVLFTRGADGRHFKATFTTRMAEGVATWRYAFTDSFAPSLDRSRAPEVGGPGKPSLSFITRTGDGQLRAGIKLASSAEAIEITRSGLPIMATLTVKQADGKTAYKRTDSLASFGFG
jgi:hypothetical protein